MAWLVSSDIDGGMSLFSRKKCAWKTTLASCPDCRIFKFSHKQFCRLPSQHYFFVGIQSILRSLHGFTLQTTAVLDLKLHYAVEDPTSTATAFLPRFQLFPTTNMFPLSGRYAVMFTPTIKGEYLVSAAFAVPGSVEATFYDDRSLISSVCL